jgi:uncharacterized HAD superfamily protein
MKLGFDVDGVLAFTTERMLDHIQAEGKLHNRSVAEITHYDWEHCFPEITGEDLMKVLRAPGFYRDLEPCGKMVSLVRRLHREGHEIHLVTACDTYQGAREDRKEWAEDNRIPYHRLVFVEAHDKHHYCKAEGLGILVEDRMDTALRCARAGIPALLIETTYNCLNFHKEEVSPLLWRVKKEHVANFFQKFLDPKA